VRRHSSAGPRLGDFTATPRVLVVAALAIPIGALAAGVAWLLLRLIGLITNVVFYSRVATSLVAPDAHHHNPVLIVAAPVVGGLVIGLLARYGSEKIRGHGMPEALEAILTGGSKVQPRVAVLKPVASALAIGTGGPFGAEGPIIMTGGALGSLVAQFVHLSDSMNAANRAQRSAALAAVILPLQIVRTILLERDTRMPSLLRTPVHETVLTDVQVTRARSTAPLVSLPFGDAVLKPVQPRVIFVSEFLDLLKDALLFFRKRLESSINVVNHADRGRETELNGAPRHGQRIVGIFDPAADY